MVMWANLVRFSFNFSCKPSHEPRQPRDADADQIGWNYQLAEWWGIQKLKRFGNSEDQKLGSSSSTGPNTEFQLRSLYSSKVLTCDRTDSNGLAWSSAWIFYKYHFFESCSDRQLLTHTLVSAFNHDCELDTSNITTLNMLISVGNTNSRWKR
jgi:hypothetical protein